MSSGVSTALANSVASWSTIGVEVLPIAWNPASTVGAKTRPAPVSAIARR
jgi:hypothetical protein